ncbi:acyl carrier protein [Candidatus Phytoplasma rubi]|uniref:Acyl carrier protein n=1 Tax=Candidatus Phytoplasma rubi TaxID=399025 RepID=A0ABY7BSE3_9MOLU|nr:acyl carrier protein [Candidatus Phytoplasma rubi]WAN63549.1 acyl carrier protein [Candidatus Phytoplasma rubi]
MIFDKVKKIICERKSIEEDKIFLETRLKEDLALDSFDAVELVIELEKIFDLKISDEAMQQFKIVKDIVNYVESNLS